MDLVVHLLLELILEPADPPLQALDVFGEEGDGGRTLLLSPVSPVRSTPTPEETQPPSASDPDGISLIVSWISAKTDFLRLLLSRPLKTICFYATVIVSTRFLPSKQR